MTVSMLALEELSAHWAVTAISAEDRARGTRHQ
jgi:hypothetical protein